MNEFDIITKLEGIIDNKNRLLKSLNNSYSSFLNSLEKNNYEGFFEQLDTQQNIINELYISDNTIAATVEKCGSFKNNILQLLRGDTKNASPYLKKLANKICLSRKLIKNSKSLNEKLIFHIKEAEKEIKNNLTIIKNKKLIRLNYKQNMSKTGLIIDFKE